MVAELGIVVGLYILTRLIPPQRQTVVAVMSILTALATVLAVADFAYRGISGKSLASFLESSQPPASKSLASKKSSETPKSVPVTITRVDGGSITTTLGYGIAVAKNSSLRREWIALHDPSMPVAFDGTPGVTTIYSAERYSGQYYYQAKFKIFTKEPVTAIQVRFLIFDVWGNHVRSLSFQQVTDIEAGVTRELEGRWSLYSENDVERHYASIAYVARVRLKDGRVVVASDEPVIEEARKFTARFTAEDLESKSEPREDKGADKSARR